MQKSSRNQRSIQYYDKLAQRHKNDNLVHLDASEAYQFTKMLDILALPKGKKIIELGCGTGKGALFFLRSGYPVTASDISKNSLLILKEQAKKNKLDRQLKVVLNNFSKPLFSNEYDAGLCISTFHVLSDNKEERIKILTNFTKSLKRGGKLLLVEPNPLNPLFYLFYLFYPSVQRESVHNFLGSATFTLKKILQEIGFEEITVYPVGFLPLRLMKKIPETKWINELINRIPFLKNFSSFNYILAFKK